MEISCEIGRKEKHGCCPHQCLWCYSRGCQTACKECAEDKGKVELVSDGDIYGLNFLFDVVKTWKNKREQDAQCSHRCSCSIFSCGNFNGRTLFNTEKMVKIERRRVSLLLRKIFGCGRRKEISGDGVCIKYKPRVRKHTNIREESSSRCVETLSWIRSDTTDKS